MARRRKSGSILHRHGLGLIAVGVVLALAVLYSLSDEHTHLGSFFGNAVADWTGVAVTVLATKHFYESGSAESKEPRSDHPLSPVLAFLYRHSLTIFLLITGAGWVAAYLSMGTDSKWGQVVGNIVSEWTQILGLVLITKRFVEIGSKESRH